MLPKSLTDEGWYAVQASGLVWKLVLHPWPFKRVCPLKDDLRPAPNTRHAPKEAIAGGELEVRCVVMQVPEHRPKTLVCGAVQD